MKHVTLTDEQAQAVLECVARRWVSLAVTCACADATYSGPYRYLKESERPAAKRRDNAERVILAKTIFLLTGREVPEVDTARFLKRYEEDVYIDDSRNPGKRFRIHKKGETRVLGGPHHEEKHRLHAEVMKG